MHYISIILIKKTNVHYLPKFKLLEVKEACQNFAKNKKREALKIRSSQVYIRKYIPRLIYYTTFSLKMQHIFQNQVFN